MFLIIIMLAVIIGVVLLALVYVRKNAGRKTPPVDLKNKISKLNLGPEYTSVRMDAEENKLDGAIKILYTYNADGTKWICPNCEVENLANSRKCVVCYTSRR